MGTDAPRLAGRAALIGLLRGFAIGAGALVPLSALVLALGPTMPLLLLAGAVISYVTARLVKERAHAVAAERWLSTTLHSIGDAVIATDTSGRVVLLNPGAEALTGWSSHEAMGRPLAQVFRILDEVTRAPVASPVERVLHDARAVDLADGTVLVDRHGKETVIDDSAAPIRDDSGAVVGVVLVCRDIGARRRGEQRRRFLGAATEKLASSLDYETTLATVTRAAVPDIADWCAVDILEQGQVKRLAIAHADPHRLAQAAELERRYPPEPDDAFWIPRIMRTGEPEMISDVSPEVLAEAARDDEHLDMLRRLSIRSYIAVPLRIGGRTIGVLTLATAESNRRYGPEDLALAVMLADRAAVAIDHARLFRAVEQARTEAVIANRSKDEFLAMLGHELRNPLAPIVTAIELMKMRGGNGLEPERAIIERQVARMVRLVDDLLDVARITQGRITISRKVVDLAEVVAQAVEIVRPLVDERHHAVTVDVQSGLTVMGDAVRLGQVVANLLDNAAKYTEPGGHLAVVGERADCDIVLRVRDDGIGIDPRILPHVFDAFVQQPQALDRARGGLGIGLAIVRSLVALHGGSVSASSEGSGRGSEFTVRLPAHDPSRNRAVVDDAERAGAQHAPPSRILVVDDNEDALEMLAEGVALLGHEPHRAIDGASALEVAAKVHPKLALLDIGLPNVDGYEVGRRLRGLEGLHDIKLVAVTGYGQSRDRARSLEAGFDAHLVKPVGIDDIQSVIDRLIR